MMNNKLALNIQKLDLPLPAIREGPGGGEAAEIGIQGTNLKNIIQQQLQKKMGAADVSQSGGGHGQIQTQAESMKVFTQLQESIKNLVKNNKFIVENNNVEK